MTLFMNRSARVITLIGLVSASFLYYQSTRPVDNTFQIQVNDEGRVVNPKLSQSDKRSFVQETTNNSGTDQPRVQDEGVVRTTSTESPWSEGETKKTGRDSLVTSANVADRKCYSEAGASVWTHPQLKPSAGSYLRNLDLSKYRQQDAGYLKGRIDEMISRTTHVSKWCKSHSQLAASSNLSLVWYPNHEPNIIWCPIYKVAPTSWFSKLVREGNSNETNSKNHIRESKDRKKARDSNDQYLLHSPPTDEDVRDQVFSNSLRVLVVRNPYNRIISAYLDKIAKRNPRQEYFQYLQRKIIKEYREDRKSKTSPYPTFPEFFQYVLDSTTLIHTADHWMGKVHCWRPYWVQCNVCAADYDLILKMETLEEDEKFLLTLANLTKPKDVRRPKRDQSSKKIPTQEAKYLKQLDRKQLNFFYMQYIIDFELFGYLNKKNDYA
ncbi:carbohydrate sulfotransferase 11-like [Panulirus ornatus]|uniref:carbohydrate sulfotransferase 11-like n=1 Tax=Panulirus ornatus TaxID=150431 RepID=UPI003A8AAD91